MKQADRIGARAAIVLDDDGAAQLRDMASGEQRPIELGRVDRRADGSSLMTPEFPALRANDYRDTWCGQVLADRVDAEARLAGWVHRRRDHGGLVFIDLRDRTGLVQLVFHPEDSGEAFELSHRLRAEDVLTVAGQGRAPRRRDRQPRAADRRVRARASRRRR